MTLPANFVKQALSDPLGAVGFSRIGRRNVWVRPADAIHHAVSLEQSHGSWKVRWDVVEPSVGQVLHGRLAEIGDVAYSGIISGHAQPALRPDLVASFTRTELVEGGRLVAGVRIAADQVVGWLSDFPDVQSVLDYLTGDFDAPDRRVTIPTHTPLRLLVAAALAAVGARADASDLADRAKQAIGEPRTAATRDRLERLDRLLG